MSLRTLQFMAHQFTAVHLKVNEVEMLFYSYIKSTNAELHSVSMQFREAAQNSLGLSKVFNTI